jgi:hypothetical protein
VGGWEKVSLRKMALHAALIFANFLGILVVSIFQHSAAAAAADS